MTFQYQFVEGIEPFSSFYDLIIRIPPKVAIYSTILIVAVFLFYAISRKSSLSGVFPNLIDKIEKNDIERETQYEYSLFSGFERRGIQFRDILNFSITVGFGIIGVLFITQTVFFAVIPTQSMLPTLRPSDLVLVESFSKHNVEVGDILVFRPPNAADVTVFDPRNNMEAVPSYVHRVISISEDGKIQTAGDNGKVPDPFQITQKHVVGKVAEFNGNPVVFRGKGIYFMPGKVTLPLFANDPMFRGAQSGIGMIQESGPIYIVIMLLLASIELARSAVRSGGRS